MNRLLRTSAVRIALAYVAVFALALGSALAAMWWSTRWFAHSGVEGKLAAEHAALAGDPAAIAATLATRAERGLAKRRFYLLTDADGEKLAGNMRVWPPEPEIPIDGAVHALWVDEDAFPPGLYQEEAFMPLIASRLPDGRRLLLARGGKDVGALRELTLYLAEVLSVAVLLSLILGVAVGRRILARMDAASRTAAAIVHGDLSQRVPLGARDDEFDALARRLNAMLDRIQQLVRGLREVTDNVAHDLRRPLSRLRNRMEVALLEPRGPEEYREVLAQGVQDADTLIRTFNTLLDIAQAEAAQNRGDWGPVNLNDLAHDLAELYGATAEEKGLVFELEVLPSLGVTGSRELLARAIGNLLENAIKYTDPPGRVRLEVLRRDGAAEVVVTDSGPGIPLAERAHVLERFVRLDTARNTPGNGLGLSLARAAAAAHGAQLLLEDAQQGLRVRLRFDLG